MGDQAELKSQHAAYAKRTSGGRQAYRHQMQQVNERKLNKSHFDLAEQGNPDADRPKPSGRFPAVPHPSGPELYHGVLAGLADKGNALVNKFLAYRDQRFIDKQAKFELSDEIQDKLSKLPPEQRENAINKLRNNHNHYIEELQKRAQHEVHCRDNLAAIQAEQRAKLIAADKFATTDFDPAKAITVKSAHFDRRMADGDIAELSPEEREEAGINNVTHGLLARDALTHGEAPAHGADNIYRDNKTGALYIGGRSENGDVSVRPITELPSEEAIIDAGVAHDTVVLHRIEALNAAGNSPEVHAERENLKGRLLMPEADYTPQQPDTPDMGFAMER